MCRLVDDAAGVTQAASACAAGRHWASFHGLQASNRADLAGSVRAAALGYCGSGSLTAEEAVAVTALFPVGHFSSNAGDLCSFSRVTCSASNVVGLNLGDLSLAAHASGQLAVLSSLGVLAVQLAGTGLNVAWAEGSSNPFAGLAAGAYLYAPFCLQSLV